MRKVKHFNQFIKEVSGTELVGPVGPAYGETRLQNKTVDFHDTKVIFSKLDNRFYSIDEWNDLYQNYLVNGGEPLSDGFNSVNLDSVIDFLTN